MRCSGGGGKIKDVNVSVLYGTVMTDEKRPEPVQSDVSQVLTPD